MGFLARQRRPLIRHGPEVGRGGITDGGIEPVAQRHAGTARGGLGPLPDGWIDALNTPRYARIHALVRFRIRRATPRLQPPRASLTERQSNSAQVVCLWLRLFRVTVNNQLRNPTLRPESCLAGMKSTGSAAAMTGADPVSLAG